MLRRSAVRLLGAFAVVVAVAAVTAQDDVLTAQADPAAGGQRVAVPAYFEPGAYWQQLDDGAPTAALAIANPDSGPGGSSNAQYTDAISAATGAGTAVIGYVDTGYFGTTGRTTRDGRTSVAAWTEQIAADVDAWYTFYGDAGLAGIFFDDALNDCGPDNAHVALYEDLRSRVRAHDTGARVVDNPGTGTDECYTAAADTLVTYEGSYADYTAYQPQPWEASAPPDAIWHLVYHAVDTTAMEHAVALSQARNAGYVYVTPDGSDDGQQNPWDTLPPAAYWSDELARAAGG